MRDWKAFVRERLRLPGLPPERESHIVRELAAQLEDFYREALAGGASEPEADAHARRQIGDWEQLTRDVWVAERAHARPRMERLADRVEMANPAQGGAWQMLADVLRDGRYGVRQLTKSPAFAVVAILTLALGIGATSAMFSVINGVLLRPLPFPEPEALVRVNEIVPQYGRFSVAPATFLDWRAQSTSFERIVAAQSGSASFVGSNGAERINNALVSWDFFEMCARVPGARPGVHGGGRRPGQEQRGRPQPRHVAAAVRRRPRHRRPLDHAQRRAGDDHRRDAPGVRVSGRRGVLGADCAQPGQASRGGHFLAVVARLKPGVTAAQAGAEMKMIAERLAKQYPKESADESAEVVSVLDQMVGGARQSLLALLAAVAVVVLIACANVANLLLVRASVREKEIAIRMALGAGKARLVRQMLAESLVLAISGGVLGVLLAYVALGPIRTLSAGSIPRVQDITIDGTVLLFAVAMSLATGLIFGLAPAWQASRQDRLGHEGRRALVGDRRRPPGAQCAARRRSRAVDRAPRGSRAAAAKLCEGHERRSWIPRR